MLIHANASSKFLKFAYMDKAGVKFGANDADVESLGQFFIYYNATEKRIYLRAKGTIQKPDATNWWSQCVTEGTDKWNISDPINSLTNDYALKNWVDLQLAITCVLSQSRLTKLQVFIQKWISVSVLAQYCHLIRLLSKMVCM